MSKEEERPARVTRGALRRMSVEQEPTSAPGTPKIATTGTKKSAALDAIQEGSTGPSDIEEDSATTKTKKDVTIGNKSLQKIKEHDVGPVLRTNQPALNEDSMGQLENYAEIRRTPRRRLSQDSTGTPHTATTTTRRKTRRNSATSDDGNMPTTTPKASKSRLSVAPPTIAEDDEKEDKTNTGSAPIAEAELSDLDIRKLRNRSISNSPIPRTSPSGKNTSLGSHKPDEAEVDTAKPLSPTKEGQEAKSSESVVNLPSDGNVVKTPTKRDDSMSTVMSPVGSVKRQLKDVTFEESTPNELEKSVYPKTPIVSLGEKRRKLSETIVSEVDDSLSVTPEVIDETVVESPKVKKQGVTTSPTVAVINNSASPAKSTSETTNEQSLDKTIDTFLANIVEEVRENINQIDQSISILGTPKTTGNQKSHFSHLREGTFSTPIAKPPEVDEAATSESPASKSWTQAVKGTGNDKGIDVFSVRKQEEKQRQEEETERLNESLKRKALNKKVEVDNVEEEEEDEEEDDNRVSQRNSFIDDEAMEIEGYQSGDSMDSDTRKEINDHEIDDGESLGSKDSEIEEDDEEDDSFIATDDEEFDLLDGSGDDLESGKEEDKSKGKKTHKRIIQNNDSSDEEQSLSNLDNTATSECKSPGKTPKKGEEDLNSTKSPKSTPAKGTPHTSSSSITPGKTPSKNTVEEQEHSSEVLNVSSSSDETKSPTTPAKNTPDTNTNSKTPIKNSVEDQNHKSPKRETPQDKPQTPKSKTLNMSQKIAQSPGAEEHSIQTIKTEASVEKSESQKSLPIPALISADFYTSSKRHSINVKDTVQPSEKPAEIEEPSKNSNLVTNPAALALAKKNKRLSLEASCVEGTAKKDKRASLPTKLPVDKEIESPLKRKRKNTDIPEENGTALDPAEAMDVDENEDVMEDSVVKHPMPLLKKKKVKDLSEYDTSAILARCNEIVRSDKEKRKQGATLKQKKKDEKRRQREEEQQEENNEANEPQKKKKKKKKEINYLLEELGEKKEDQLSKALQRRMALFEAKKERKKARKAAKLQQQLNKENQDEKQMKEGIGSKFEKKTKKEKKAKKESKVQKSIVETPTPVVKRAISAFAVYSAQIEELKKEQAEKKKPKRKQLKEKNQQPSAAEEVKVALQSQLETKAKKDKGTKKLSTSAPALDNSNEVDKTKVAAENPTKHIQQKKNAKNSSHEPHSSIALQTSNEDRKEDLTEKPKKLKKKGKSTANEPKSVDLLFAPLRSVVPSNDDDLATLKKSLMEPISKVVKKQKISQNNENLIRVSVAEATPPRKLKALARLESGFREEPVTPEHKLLKRNRGFKEEPVTPKTIGFKVSNVLPAGQEALQQQAVLGKKKKIYSNSNRIRPEDVKEPISGLALPIWTRSGTFDVEELADTKLKKSKSTESVRCDIIPLNANQGGQCSTDFLLKPLGSKKKKPLADGSSKAHRIDLATVDESVINFKKQAIFGKNAHLREKKTKH